MTKRREFIRKSVMGNTGKVVGDIGFGSKSYAYIVGANEHITLAVIGMRNKA